MVTFETKCWEEDWPLLLKTSYLEEQIARNDFTFAERRLFINNVADPDEVSHHARRLVSSGVLTGYYLVEEYAAEALDFFQLSKEALGRGYAYSIAELVALYLCRTPYLLHFAGDCILETKHPWVADALREFARNNHAVVANPTWNGCYGEAAQEAHSESGGFLIGYGFSDQCYLARTADLRGPIYGEEHTLSARFPAHGGNSFERRVDAWMRNHGRPRLTHRHVSYRHIGRPDKLRAFVEMLAPLPAKEAAPPQGQESESGGRQLRILILLLYYERPVLVRNALRSILKAHEHHQSWELVVIDDGSEAPALPVVAEVMAGHYDKVRVIETRMTAEDKLRYGCMTGLAMNQAIERSNADVGIMLCDDDALYPTYLGDLSRFLTENPDVLSCYSQVIVYDALSQQPEESTDMNSPLNRHTTPICGHCMVDASQCAWRLKCNKEYGVWFSYPLSRNHDAEFYAPLYNKCGPMMPTGFVGQYKGIHPKELGFVGPEKAWTEKNIDREPPERSPKDVRPQRFFVVADLFPAPMG